MRASFLGCCASATAPHNANVTTMAKNPTNFGFWILRHGSGQVLDFRLKEKESRIRTEDFSFIPFISPNPKSKIVSADKFLNLLEQNVLVNRLRNIVVTARFARLDLVPDHGMR